VGPALPLLFWKNFTAFQIGVSIYCKKEKTAIVVHIIIIIISTTLLLRSSSNEHPFCNQEFWLLLERDNGYPSLVFAIQIS